MLARLANLLSWCPSEPPLAQRLEACGAATVGISFQTPGEQHGFGGQDHSQLVMVPVDVLRIKAALLASAARRWAAKARAGTLIMAGEDSPAFQAWTNALRKCWQSTTVELAGGKPTQFVEVWTTAGLSLSPKVSKLSSICQPEATIGGGNRVGMSVVRA